MCFSYLLHKSCCLSLAVHRGTFGSLRHELCKSSVAFEKPELEHVAVHLAATSCSKLGRLCTGSLFHEQFLSVADISMLPALLPYLLMTPFSLVSSTPSRPLLGRTWGKRGGERRAVNGSLLVNGVCFSW